MVRSTVDRLGAGSNAPPESNPTNRRTIPHGLRRVCSVAPRRVSRSVRVMFHPPQKKTAPHPTGSYRESTYRRSMPKVYEELSPPSRCGENSATQGCSVRARMRIPSLEHTGGQAASGTRSPPTERIERPCSGSRGACTILQYPLQYVPGFSETIAASFYRRKVRKPCSIILHRPSRALQSP
jgi:hypothetical protein